jgi:hypothetical protein
MSPRIRRLQQLEVIPAPLIGRYGLFRERLEVRTNDPRVLSAAAAAFDRFVVPELDRSPLVVKVVVREPRDSDDRASEHGPCEARNLVHDTAGHLFSITLGPADRGVVDIAAGFGTATIGPDLAHDAAFLRYAFLEAMAQAMLTGGRGYVPIHASCVVRDGIGFILQAPAGTGKSTLAFTCARRGWGLLAEDVVFARPVDGAGGDGELELWGMPWTQRLLPDATRFFPELADATARRQANGEDKLEVDLDVHAPGTATPRALAGPVVLLARATGGPTHAEWLPCVGDPAAEVEVLWPWDSGWTAAHERTAVRLMDRGILRLHLNSTPDEAVDALEDALAAAAGGTPGRVPAGSAPRQD